MDYLRLPTEFPNSAHEVIVYLESIHLAVLDVDTGPKTHEMISYHNITEPAAVRERIQCASIIIALKAKINKETVGKAPYLKCIITPTAGTNHIDLAECQTRGIRVINTPGGTADAVSEHALALYFATRRKIVAMHGAVADRDENGENLWKGETSAVSKMRMANSQPPNSLNQEIVGIFGYGFIGKRLENLCRALGMKVLISERKDALTMLVHRADRLPFDEVVESASVLFITCPHTCETINMIDEPEFAAMRSDAIVINVSRGGVVNENSLVRALQAGKISGAGVDVFDIEPASSPADSVLLSEYSRDLNLVFSPHAAYFSAQTILNMQNKMREHLENWIAGNKIDFVV